MAALPEKAACRLTVDILALAHDRGCETELATVISGLLAANELPDMAKMRARFAPDPTFLPDITVPVTPLGDYNALLAAVPAGEAAGTASDPIDAARLNLLLNELRLSVFN